MRRFAVLGMVMALIGGWAVGGNRPLVKDDGQTVASFAEVRTMNVDERGIPTFVAGKLGNIGRGDVVGESLHFLKSVRPMLKAAGDEEFSAVSTEVDRLGYSHVKFQQYVNGLPVDGAEMVVHANTRTGDILILNGNFIPDEDLPRRAEIDGREAFAIAAAEAGIFEGKVLDEPTLTYVAENGKGYLAWTARIAYSVDGMPLVDRLYADARTGEMVAIRALVKTAKYRKIYNANHADPNSFSGLGTLMFVEGGSSTDTDAMAAYTNTGITYDYYKARFNRDSYDNAGANLISSVHLGTNWVNAYWMGTQMAFGDGDGSQASSLAKDLDVVAHELTHAVTDVTANLAYQNDSGALNEAMSDCLGAATSAYKDGAVSANTWKIGETCWTPATSGDALRYMNNPTQDGSSTDYWPERNYASGCSPSYYNDYCGVHTNSGIGNLAFYLLSQGGTHPRSKTTTVVTGIGIAKAEQIFFRALTTGLMTSSTTYAQARTACKTAAEQLYGVGSAEATQTENAFAAVGVGSGTTPPPTVTTLTNGQSLGSQGTTQGAYLHYKITVPSGQTQLQVVTTGGTGDADMYVKRGAQASTSSYDGKSEGGTCAETVTITSPVAGDFYIALYAYSTFSGVTIKATYTGSTPNFTLAASPTSVSVAQGASGTSTITAAASGGFSSAVALTASGTPTGATVSFSPTSIAGGSGTSTMTLAAGTAAAGTYTITVTGTGGSLTKTCTVSLTVTTGGGGGVIVLTNGVAKTSLAGATGSWTHYKITVPASQTSLAIVMSGGTGDGDMYVKRGAQPTSTSYDYRPYLSGNNETVNVTNPVAGDWFISIYGYSAYSGVSLKATYAAGGGGGTGTETEANNTTATANTVTTGTTYTAKIGTSSDVDFFKLSLPASRTITIDVTVPSTKDYDVKLYASNGTTVLGTGSNGTGAAEKITYTNGSTAQTVYIKVYGYNGAYSSSLTYTVKATW